MKNFLIVGFLILVSIYFVSLDQEPDVKGTSTGEVLESTPTSIPTPKLIPAPTLYPTITPFRIPLYFNNYPCTQDCSGHEAGYEWAEEHDIDDVDDCGGNSQSFIEGCESYVEENYGDSDNYDYEDDYYDDSDYDD